MSGEVRTLIKGHSLQYVKLMVGGRSFFTTIGTLTKRSPSLLSSMFNGNVEVLMNEEGFIMIDRCGKQFGLILNYLRDGSIPLPETQREVMALMAEAKYYALSGLIAECEQTLARWNEPKEIARVPMITSPNDEQTLINSTTKPIIIFAVQRLNNEYPFTAISDHNLLKNIETFDKLSSIYSERVLFIRDVVGSKEVCSWSFYGHGRKVGQVCCASVILKDDLAMINVEFPEAKIYEEILLLLLCENCVTMPASESMVEQDIFDMRSNGRDISSVAGNSSYSSEMYSTFGADADESEEATQNDEQSNKPMPRAN